MEDTKGQLTKTTLIAVGISTTLILLVILQHNLAFQKNSTIVLPAGGTYLGPSSGSPTAGPLVASASQSAFVTVKGRKYHYSFESPDTLKLVTFPNDSFDIYALSINNQPPEQNVLIGVEDLNRTEELKQYIQGSKRTYVENWWKQFSGLKGAATITPFTNKGGLKGYKAKYINTAGQTTNDDVFFETPNPAYVIHLGNGPLPKAIFDAIVDSVAWTIHQ